MTRSLLICCLIGGILLSGIARGEDLASPPAEHAAALDNWDMSSYRVLIYVRIDPAPGWTAARRKDIVAEVADRAAGLVGGVWHVEAAEAPADLHWDHASALDHVALDALPTAAMERDKVILLGIEQSAEQAPSILARELDVRTRLWSGVVAQPGSSLAPSTADLAQDAVRAAWKSFRPLARIESIADQGVTVRIRGGGIAAGNHAAQLARPGSVWQPIIRHFDVAGKTIKDGVFPIAATWLRTSTIDGATAHCSLVTGVQNPLAVEYDGRTEYLALAVTSQPSTGTAIVCLTHGPPERPLVGLDILVRDSADHPPRLVGQTDSSGTFRVTSAASDVLTVYIRGGDDLLGRFPLVPGLDPTMTIRLDDTGRRPEKARFVEAMRMDLLDTATQKQLLLTRFQHQYVNGQSEEAAKTVTKLLALPTLEQFLKSIDTDRSKLTTVLADPTASAWLDKRLEEIKTLAAKNKNLFNEQDLANLKNVLSSMGRK